VWDLFAFFDPDDAKPVFRIRIRMNPDSIRSVDPDLESGSGSRRENVEKLPTKVEKK
jgi:hypothetical protein